MSLQNFPSYNFWTTESLVDQNPPTLRMDLVENEKSFVVTAQTPGASKEDIKVVFENDVLTVAVTRNIKKKSDKEHLHFTECFHSSTSRSIRFQHGKIDAGNIDAKYENGQLVINLNFVKDFKENTAVDVKIN
jgi:HSP20 family protein